MQYKLSEGGKKREVVRDWEELLIIHALSRLSGK